MNYSIGAIICFILVGALALVGLILLYWNPSKKKDKGPRITKVESDFTKTIKNKKKKKK